MNRLNKTESADFLYCRFSLFRKDPFFQITPNLSVGFVYTFRTRRQRFFCLSCQKKSTSVYFDCLTIELVVNCHNSGLYCREFVADESVCPVSYINSTWASV